MDDRMTDEENSHSKAAAVLATIIFVGLLVFLIRPANPDECLLVTLLSLFIAFGFLGSAFAETPKGKFIVLAVICSIVAVLSYTGAILSLAEVSGKSESVSVKIPARLAAYIFLSIGTFFAVALVVSAVRYRKRARHPRS